jgi:hypothetical protein
MPAKKSSKQAGPAKKSSQEAGFSADEKAAMKAYLKEKRGEKGNGPADLKAAIAAMPPGERALAQRIHELVVAAAPGLEQKTWYGFPAYAKFKERYCTFGFNQYANLQEGGMWVTSFAIVKPSAADEAKLSALVRKAVA